ncbi:zinc finger E-box-binding homeobox 1 [Thalassophryne amazonica]|uniref:zinc finger E-box-binding homeobox 1 n=1 Tax=Thalassophryne amazonica TaxID=390379 RepID=UPI0014715D22|nr:zinc finger E-box-binding homeobox 1 [Thalassophryne amazonica]
MDSQLATVLTSGNLDVQNVSQHVEGSGQVSESFLDFSLSGNVQPCCPLKAVTIREDALSINGEKPEVGGASEPASQETNKIGGFRQPIAVKTGVPVLYNRPIRIKIVVPTRCKQPIAKSTISLTKDFSHSYCRKPTLESTAGKKAVKIQKESEEEGGELTCQQTKEPKTEVHKEKSLVAETLAVSGSSTVEAPGETLKKEDTNEEWRRNNPVILQAVNLSRGVGSIDSVKPKEQTEPLDLSLPKKRERERKCVRFLDDSGCESSLIMEVDEYEGEGDRDIVEEDDEKEDAVFHMNGTDSLEDSLMFPSFFSSSVFTSLTSINCDNENLLLIDDQGIPYTLSPDGLKVPQVDTSKVGDPQSDQLHSADTEGTEPLHLPKLAGPNLNQSLDDALHTINAPCDDVYSSPALATDLPLVDIDQSNSPEVLPGLQTPVTSDSSKISEPSVNVQEAGAVVSQAPGIPCQPLQILRNPSANTPILLFSSTPSPPQLSSTPLGLTLPLSVTQSSPGASSPVLLLLSSGDSTTPSTSVAVLDPLTGQLSQITGSSPSVVPLSLASGQVSTSASPVSTIAHPVIRLSPSNAPLLLSGVKNINSGSVLTSLSVPSSTSVVQTDNISRGAIFSTTPLIHTHISSSDLNPETEAIPAEVSNENKPFTFEASSSPHQLPVSLTSDPLVQPSLAVEEQSPTTELMFNPSDLQPEHLPLEDHLYFSNTIAPLSPPTGPILSACKLDQLDPLDSLSPALSPNAMGARRVLYCQLCPRVFFYLSDLERHAITHSQKKPHVCQQCGKAFKRSSHLQRHKHIHTGQRNFVCPICAKRFREAGELQRHQRVHTGEKPYQCQLCHTRFAERNTLRRHTKRKHPYHQVAMEMLSERRDRGDGRGGSGASRVLEEEESAEWYSSTVSNLENSESEMET